MPNEKEMIKTTSSDCTSDPQVTYIEQQDRDAAHEMANDIIPFFLESPVAMQNLAEIFARHRIRGHSQAPYRSTDYAPSGPCKPCAGEGTVLVGFPYSYRIECEHCGGDGKLYRRAPAQKRSDRPDYDRHYEPVAVLRKITEWCEKRGATHETADKALDHIYGLACSGLDVARQKRSNRCG